MFNSSQSTLVAVPFRIESLEFLLALVVSWVAVFFLLTYLFFFFFFIYFLIGCPLLLLALKCFKCLILVKEFLMRQLNCHVLFCKYKVSSKNCPFTINKTNACLQQLLFSLLQSTLLETSHIQACIFTIINNQMSEKSIFGINIICLLSLLISIIFQQQYLALRIKLWKRLTDTYMRLASAAFSS